MFKVNDAVFYGIHGVCTVEGICEKEFCGAVNSYYTLKPVYTNRSTVFVPVERADKGNVIRKVISKDTALEIISKIPHLESKWIIDDAERKKIFAEILKSGSVFDIASLIKTLYECKLELAKTNKKIHASDERVLAEAEKNLHEEFAFVLDIPRENVLTFIKEHLGICD